MKRLLLCLSFVLLLSAFLHADEVTIGAGNQTARIPMDMYYRNSLFECIYLQSELNFATGTITAVTFYNTFTTNISASPTNIWLGNTTLSNLSAGMIPSGQLTPVFSGPVNYPNGANTIAITLDSPFVYTGGNLVMLVQRPMDTVYYSINDRFYCQTIGTNRARKAYNDNTAYDPANPPSGSLSGQFPKTTFTYTMAGVGALNGTVYDSASQPLDGATVAVAGTTLSYTTGATGAYNFPYVLMGDHSVTAAKHGYISSEQTVTVSESQTTTQDFYLQQLPTVTLSGRIVGSDAPDAGIEGAGISLTGYEPYSATSGTGGYFSIPGVYANQAYAYAVTAQGYANASGQYVVGTQDADMGTLILSELAIPPTNVLAAEAADLNSALVTWSPPGTFAGEWIHYDSGENHEAIGTGGAVDFTVAIRFPASAMADYAGAFLGQVKVWPASAGNFSVRVWTGGSASAPGTLVIDQAFTPTLQSYNTVDLSNMVAITGSEELWIGMRCVVNNGYPAGCDAGPAVNGLGNMIYFNNNWSTLLQLAPNLDFNWNIQGYVGSGSKDAPQITLAGETGRSLVGYQVWRLLQGQESNESAWASLTPAPIVETSFTDTAWAPQPSGIYKFAVKSAYTNGVLSVPAFSNSIEKGMIGSLTGTVTDSGSGLPIAGALVTAGSYSGSTNTAGIYQFTAYQGTYTVTCTKTGYQNYSVDNVYIPGAQITTLNITLNEITLPVSHVEAAESADHGTANLSWFAPGTASEPFADGFETYDNFTLSFPPWTLIDGDQRPTYGLNQYNFPNESALMAFMIFNPSATTPPMTSVTAHGGSKMAACFACQPNPINDDWLISPQFTPASGDVFSFWARSYTASYGLERFTVGISTTGTDPGDFSIISGSPYVQVPVAWTPYSYSLSAYAGQPIYVALHCVSNDAYILFVDDVLLGAPAKSEGLGQVAALDGDGERVPPPPIWAQPKPIQNPGTIAQTSARTLLGYRVWRLPEGAEANPAAWISVTDADVPDTFWADQLWGTAPTGNHRWAVKSAYSGGLLGPPAFSNVLTRGSHTDICAVSILGPQNPVIGQTTVYTVLVQNLGNTMLNGLDYLVWLMEGTHEQALLEGVDLAPGASHSFAMEWTPSDTGPLTLTGWVDMIGDAIPANDITPGLQIEVLDEPLPFELSSFTALATAGNQVTLAWTTQSETGMLGFLLYRNSSADQATALRITPALIPAGNTSNAQNYQWTDSEAGSGQIWYYWLECVEFNQSSYHGPVSVQLSGEVPPVLPEVSTLRAAYPNPFRNSGSTCIEVGIKAGETGLVTIYNVAGQTVKSFSVDAGFHTLNWNGRDANGKPCGSGIYFYRLSTPSLSQTRKLALVN